MRLKGITKLINISNMFKGEIYDSIPLSSLPDISKWNTQNVTDMSSMFEASEKYKIPKNDQKVCSIF